MASKRKTVTKRKISKAKVTPKKQVTKTPDSSHTLLMLAIAAALIVSSYVIFSDSWRKPMMPAAIPTPMANSYYVQLSAQNNSGQNGTALFTAVGDKTQVHLELTNAPKNVAQPAHIHIGSCTAIGAIKYPLTNAINGVSDTTIDINIAELRKGGQLSLNAHQSVSQMGVYVSCGNLSF